MKTQYATLGEVEAVIGAFEQCTLPATDWNHAAHLTVGIWYMVQFEETEATERMIRGIQRYNLSQGIRTTPTSGYHETITLFWLSVAKSFASQVCGDAPVLEAVNRFVDHYAARRDLLQQHYSREVLFSPLARYCWVEPDLRPLAA